MKKKNKFLVTQSIILLILTIIFTIIVFLTKNYYFSDFWKYEEEKYLDPIINVSILKEGQGNYEIKENKINEMISAKEITQLIEQNYRVASKFYFEYFPKSFEKKAEWYVVNLSTFLQSSKIKKMVHWLKIEIHQPLYDVRGRMIQKVLKLFGVSQMKSSEFVSVWIHEFSHYVDIYFLEKKVIRDLSNNFYDISWQKTKVLKPWQTNLGFVSGYAMTNKYEDFAESFTYYILHNQDFLMRSKKSEILKMKYDFFNIYIFKQWEFKEEDFSVNNKVRDYYRDITKIDIDLEKLLQYLEKSI